MPRTIRKSIKYFCTSVKAMAVPIVPINKVILFSENAGAMVFIDKLDEYKLSTFDDHEDSSNKKNVGPPTPIPIITKIKSDC